MQTLSDYLNRYKDDFELISFKKRDFLLQQGQVSRNIYWVDEGILRLWHNTGEEDITVNFFLEGQLVSSFESFFHQEESEFSLQAVSDGQAYLITYDKWENLLGLEPELEKLLFRQTMSLFHRYFHLYLNYITYSPEERYQKLSKDHADWLERDSYFL